MVGLLTNIHFPKIIHDVVYGLFQLITNAECRDWFAYKEARLLEEVKLGYMTLNSSTYICFNGFKRVDL